MYTITQISPVLHARTAYMFVAVNCNGCTQHSGRDVTNAESQAERRLFEPRWIVVGLTLPRFNKHGTPQATRLHRTRTCTVSSKGTATQRSWSCVSTFPHLLTFTSIISPSCLIDCNLFGHRRTSRLCQLNIFVQKAISSIQAAINNGD